MYAHDEFEPDHTSSPTDTIIQDLQLYGYRPAAGEADPRITPEDHVIQTAVADIFDALTASDRPYKKAVPLEKALDILGFEVKDNHLDADLVRIFTEAKIWTAIKL